VKGDRRRKMMGKKKGGVWFRMMFEGGMGTIKTFCLSHDSLNTFVTFCP